MTPEQQAHFKTLTRLGNEVSIRVFDEDTETPQLGFCAGNDYPIICFSQNPDGKLIASFAHPNCTDAVGEDAERILGGLAFAALLKLLQKNQ
jgi:hypothetical protein